MPPRRSPLAADSGERMARRTPVPSRAFCDRAVRRAVGMGGVGWSGGWGWRPTVNCRMSRNPWVRNANNWYKYCSVNLEYPHPVRSWPRLQSLVVSVCARPVLATSGNVLVLSIYDRKGKMCPWSGVIGDGRRGTRPPTSHPSPPRSHLRLIVRASGPVYDS